MLILIDTKIDSKAKRLLRNLLRSNNHPAKAVFLHRNVVYPDLRPDIELKSGWEYPNFDNKEAIGFASRLIKDLILDLGKISAEETEKKVDYYGVNLNSVLYKYMVASNKDLFEACTRYFMVTKILEIEKDKEVVILTDKKAKKNAYKFLSSLNTGRKIKVRGVFSNNHLKGIITFLRFSRDCIEGVAKSVIYKLNFKTDRLTPDKRIVFFNNSYLLLGRVENILRILVKNMGLNLNILGFSANRKREFDFKFNLIYLDKVPLSFLSLFRQHLFLFRVMLAKKKIIIRHGLIHALREDLWGYLSDCLYEVTRLCEIMSRTLKSLSPKLVLFTMRNMPGNCMGEVARKLSIPTVYLQEGGMFETFLIAGNIIADKYIVWSDYAKDYFIRDNVPQHKIFVAGSYDYDTLPNLKESQTDFSFSAKINNGFKRVVLFFSTAPDDLIVLNNDRKQVHHAIAEVIKKFPDHYLVIKKHPLEKDDLAKADFSKVLPSRQFTVIEECDILHLVRQVDLVINYLSTAVYPAVIFKKPQIIINSLKSGNFASLSKEGFALEVHSIKDLGSTLEKIITGRVPLEIQDTAAHRNFIYSHLYKLDGQSANRIAAYIDELVKQ